ncbi:MAG TPA: ABC transporter ATP-binding protein [Candidatus Acidoferrales bacterium]|jgi:lipopolysaccharide transport system ATP-binding protein|nr:ABC transporter ATP-binding protein [Candidatus Acidoferrales bacterium]
MSDAAIIAEGLGKKYLLHHQQEGRRYKALRDIIAGRAKSMVKLGARPSQPPVEEFWALRDVSFEIQHGEVVGIIGRNGAGKSTLLKLLSRITEPTTGRIRLRGRVASLLEVGTGFHPELTGRENIFLNGAILGMGKEEITRKFDEIVAFAEVEKFLDTPVKRYSSGMYVRLAFAVAAHLEPEILIVDEVLAVGDASFQKKCLGKMQDVSKGGRTVLFVSHNMGAVTTLCQTGIWMEKGRLIKTGPARKIVDEYLTANSETAQKVMDLSDAKRANDEGRRLRVEKVEWLSGLPLQHGEKFSVRIHVRALDEVAEVSIGIGFGYLEGGRLLSYDTDFQDGRRPDLKKNMVWAVTVTAELPLAPGPYNFSVGCRSGDAFGLDFIPQAGEVEVIMGPKTPGYIAVPGAGVRLAGDWDWQSQPPQS